MIERDFFLLSKKIAQKLSSKLESDRVSESAAAIAYYITFATFPALIALIALIPYLPIEGAEERIYSMMRSGLPTSVGNYIIEITESTLSTKRPGLVSTGFLGALWVASSGMASVIRQLDIISGSETNRGMVLNRSLAIGLTLLYLVSIVLASSLLTFTLNLESFFPDFVKENFIIATIFDFFGYAASLFILILGLSSLYYFGASGKKRYRLFSWGTVLSGLCIVIATLGFNFYVVNFGNFDQTYGSIGGIIIYMFWLYISSYVLLIGAEINQLEREGLNKAIS
jgi:membrane protein